MELRVYSFHEIIDKLTSKTNLCRNPSLHSPSLCLVSDEAREILTCALCKKTPGKNIKLFSSRRINTYYLLNVSEVITG